MSHFVNNNNDLKKLSEYLKYIQCSLIDKDMISEMLEYLIPKYKSELLVNYEINERNNFNTKSAAYYYPIFNTIYVELDEIIEWIENNLNHFSESYDIDEDLFRAYLLLYLLLHELEHSYQGLIRLNYLKSPNKVVNVGYSIFMGLLVDANNPKIDPINGVIRNIRLRKYYKTERNFVLERNANLETFMTLKSLAKYIDDKKSMKIFSDSVRAYSVIGYENGTDGAMLHTFKELFYYSKYKKINQNDINDKDRIRFGLEISNKKRKQLIKNCSNAYNSFFE